LTSEAAESPIYYLDTSAQVERFGGTKRREFKALLLAGGHSTSTQVLREWNLYALESCTALLNSLRAAENRADVVADLSKGFGRAASRHWVVAEWVMAAETDLRVIEMRARDFLRVRARAAFRAGVATVRDGTACGVAKRRAAENTRTREFKYDFRCKKTDEICHQPAFFQQDLERARAAARALAESKREQDAEMGKKAMAILDQPAGPDYKGKACWAAKGLGGDICIALECAADEMLVTTDSSFELICPAIGRSHRFV
jgi:hypothetical protein